MTFTPATTYHFTLKLGLKGHDVAALQQGLNDVGATLVVDGDFGKRTLAAAKAYQQSDDLYVDGICGPLTQRKLAMRLWAQPQLNHRTAPGLIRGLVENESGYFVGAVNWNSPGGVDCGWTQLRITDPNFSEEAFRQAFSGPYSFDKMGGRLRVRKDGFYKLTKDHRKSWELAALAHNFPLAADKIAKGGTMSTEPAQWVITASGGRLQSPAQWCDYYIRISTMYVSDFIS